MKFIKSFIIGFLIGALLFAVDAFAQDLPANYGFEDGDYEGWVVSNGNTTLRTTWGSNGSGVQTTTGVNNYCPGGKCWTINPYGDYMVSVQPGSGSPNFDSVMTTLGLGSSEITTIRNTIYQNGGKYPTNASSISRTVYLQAGMTYTFAWQYLSTDYEPWNDGSMITLTNGPGTPTLNGEVQNYALLGFTNPGTGNYAVGSYGATGWQVAVFTVPTDGNYALAFSAFNLGDTALSPILFLDQLQGTTTLNGEAFDPIPPNEGSSAPTAPPPEPTEPTYPAASISDQQTIKLTQTNAITSNSVYLESVGDNNNVYIEQHSKFNAVRGVNGYQSMILNGSNNTVTIHQGTTTTAVGNNLAEILLTGDNNTFSLTQQHNSKYAEVINNGTGNQFNLQQNDAGGKSLFINNLGNSNIISTLQQGAGEHFIDINAPHGGVNINITQSGDQQHLFSLTLNNPGIGVTVQQTNSIGDSAAMEITCATGDCTGYGYIKN